MKVLRKIESGDFWAFDTEFDPETNEFISFAAVNGNRKVVLNNREQAKKFIKENSGLWIAHNLTIDLLNLFRDDLLREVKIVYLRNGSVLYARWGDAHFWDSFAWLPVSVKKIGDWIGLSKLESDYYSVDYVIRDAEIVYYGACKIYQIFNEMFARFGFKFEPKVSLSGIGADFLVKYSRERYGRFDKVSNWHVKRGGRVELYRTNDYVNVYDCNSLYPFSLYYFGFPYKFIGTAGKYVTGRFLYRVKVCLRDVFVAPFRYTHENEILYPIGCFETFTTDYGLEITQGVIKSLKIKERYLVKIGQADFISEFYQLRKANQALNFPIKIFLNGLIGKFAQNAIREKIEAFDNLDDLLNYKVFPNYGYAIKQIESPPPYLRSDLNFWVVENASLYMWQFLVKHENDIFYTDTDSIFIRASSSPDLPIGGWLGEFKFEGNGFFEVLQPKVYRLGEKIKAKGFRDVSSLNEVMEGHRQIQFAKVKSFYRYKRLTYPIDKRIRTAYNRRIKRGDTWWPLKIRNGKISS